MQKIKKVLYFAACLIVFSGAIFAQHTVRLPRPTGDHQIGTTTFALTDKTRPEVFTDDPNDKREILIRVWYPASPRAGAEPGTFWGNDTKELGGRLAEYMRLPKATFDDLGVVRSNSYANAELAKSGTRFPVLVFSHGYIPGFASQNTSQMEELASHGYIVFSIGHTYETIANIYPDGRAVPFSQKRLAAFGQGAGKANPIVSKLIATNDQTERRDLEKQIADAWPLLDESLRIWAADTSFLLTELETRPPKMFVGKLDMKRVGIFGMSFGGATAGQVCATDKRCKAGVNLDGMQFGDLINQPMERPFMFMQSQDAGSINRLYFEEAKDDAYYVIVKGTKHFNYSDFSLFSPDYRKAGILGTIDGDRMESIINAYVVSFFDKYLKGKSTPFLANAPIEFPEVLFDFRGGKRKKL